MTNTTRREVSVNSVSFLDSCTLSSCLPSMHRHTTISPSRSFERIASPSFFLICSSIAGEELLGEVPLIAAEDVPKKSFGSVLCELLARWCAA